MKPLWAGKSSNLIPSKTSRPQKYPKPACRVLALIGEVCPKTCQTANLFIPNPISLTFFRIFAAHSCKKLHELAKKT